MNEDEVLAVDQYVWDYLCDEGYDTMYISESGTADVVRWKGYSNAQILIGAADHAIRDSIVWLTQ